MGLIEVERRAVLDDAQREYVRRIMLHYGGVTMIQRVMIVFDGCDGSQTTLRVDNVRQQIVTKAGETIAEVRKEETVYPKTAGENARNFGKKRPYASVCWSPRYASCAVG